MMFEIRYMNIEIRKSSGYTSVSENNRVTLPKSRPKDTQELV
jgi:hypothetical protein